MSASTIASQRAGSLDEPAKLLDTAAAASRLGISKRSIQELMSERKIAYIKIGRCVRFSTADLDAFVEKNRVQAVGWKASSKRVEGASQQ